MTSSNVQEKSFFASLFDFNFTSFITLRFLKVIYKLVVALILLGGMLSLIYGLTSGSALGVISGLILAPLLTVVYLILARIGLEVVAMFFRIGDDAALAVQLLGGDRRATPSHRPTGNAGNAGNPAPSPVIPDAAAPYPADRPAPTGTPDVPPTHGQDASYPPAAPDDQATTVFPVPPPAAGGGFSTPPASAQPATPPRERAEQPPAPPVDHDGWGPTTPSR